MPDVKIKGYSGAEFEYKNVPKVWLAAPESTMDNPVLVPFTYGEALDDVEVALDFSAGDQTITMPDGYLARSAVVKKPDALVPGNIKAGESIAGITGEYEGEVPETEEKTVAADFSGGDMVLEPSDGKYLSKATVTMPDTLIPENIAEGVNIAGIIGNLAGGSNVKIKIGKFTGGNNETTITHGLGVIPDIVILTNTNGQTPTSTVVYTHYEHCIGFSENFAKHLQAEGLNKLNFGFYAYRAQGTTRGWYDYCSYSVDKSNAKPIHSANTESFVIMPTYSYSYYWIAIAGLT